MRRNKKELTDWMKTKHPTTILNDRYGGIYSGAGWIAFPHDHHDVPREVNGSDRDSAIFWDEFDGVCGKGDTPDAAYSNLVDVISSILADQSVEEFREIPLRNRDGEVYCLRRITDHEYELCGDLMYMSIHLDDDGSIYTLDPPGGPFLRIGGAIAGKAITAIRQEGERYYLDFRQE